MATHSGSEGKVFIGKTQVAEVKSWSLEVTADVVDASVIGSNWRKNQSTIKSWAGSFEAFWDEEDSNGQGALVAGKIVILNLYPEGDEEGNTYFTGNVIITSISYKASFDGLVEASFSFTGTDALSQKIVAPEPVIEVIIPKKSAPKSVVTETIIEDNPTPKPSIPNTTIKRQPAEEIEEEKIITRPDIVEKVKRGNSSTESILESSEEK